MSKKIISVLLILTLSLALFAGCSNGEQPSAGDADNNLPLQSDEELPTIKYGIFGTMIKAALIIIADEMGLDEEEGVNVELVSTTSSADALTSIISNKDELDAWGMQIMPTSTFIANGADLVIFGGNAAEGGAMIAKEGMGEHYQDLNNLKGKTILGIRGETGVLTVIGLLQDLGFDMEKDITIRWADAPSVLEGVRKGEGDVGFLPIEYTYFDEEVDVDVVFQVGEVAPNYICCRLTTSREILEARRDDFVNVLKASIRAYKVYKDDPETTIRILSEFSGQSEEYIQQNIYVDRIRFTPDPYSDAIVPFYEILRQMDFFEDPDTDIDVRDHIDISIYKQALDEIVAEYPNDATYQELVELFEQQNQNFI